jgi:Suppressor of fused protein (SUFU)
VEEEYLELLTRHYAEHWAGPAATLRWPHGPVEAVRPQFRVQLYRRAPGSFAFATRGMSAPADASALELHVLVKPSQRAEARDAVVELLAAAAHYHRTGQPLGLGHTVDFGRGWVDGSDCSCGLVSLPYLDGPKLEWMEEPRVRFLWLIPITPAERDFKREHGLEELERRFERARVDLLDPRRPPTV